MLTDPERRPHLSVQLHHTHLPKMEAAGLIEWREETETVTPGPRFEQIEPLLELVAEFPAELADDV